MIRSGNPALTANSFTNNVPYTGAEYMTLEGAVTKTSILLVIAAMSAAGSWMITASSGGALAFPLTIVGALGGFVLSMVIIFKKTTAPFVAPIYAAVEGLFLGAISMVFDRYYPGIVIQAISLTFGVTAALLMAYISRVIKPTQNFRLGVVAATGGIALFYIVSLVLSLFGVMPHIHASSSPLSIGFSFFVVVIAALNLVLDFDFIENAAAAQTPKYMEWYAAFGLMVTLVWLYIEILHLLAKLRGRD